MRFLFPLALITLLSSCHMRPNAYKMAGLSIGMDKTSVIQTVGHPTSMSAKENIEYFRYKLYEQTKWDPPTMYFVRFIDGKVESYGKVGDFDSAKPFETSIDLKVNSD